MELNDSQLSQFQSLLARERADSDWMKKHADFTQCRSAVRQAIQALLQEFLEGSVSPGELRATFDAKTRSEWETFGLKGLSGAMFLNMLVKYVPDQRQLADQLRETLRLPKNDDEAREQMGSLMEFLLGLIKAGQASRQHLQPARLPFFVSACWHMQNTEQWPIFYASARQVLEQQGLLTPTGEVIEDYLTFRKCFLSLAQALKLSTWELERLCSWQYDSQRQAVSDQDSSATSGTSSIIPAPLDGEEEEEGPTHTQVQWQLATIGKHFGCRVWVAANDRSREWSGQKLSSLSIPALPNLGMGPAPQKIISLIDVLWLKGANQVIAAFEIEQSTSIFSGLLRMSDLAVLCQNLSFPLYVVAPQDRMERVRQQLERPTFQVLELHKRCGFFSTEELLSKAEEMMRWASSPSAIEKLAMRVSDVAQEED